MGKVEMDAHGRKVTVEHDGELAHLADAAERLWRGTAGPDRLGAGFALNGHARPESAPVAVGGYSARPRPRVTGEVGSDG